MTYVAEAYSLGQAYATTLHTYTDHRDDSRVRRETLPKWTGVSSHHGAVVWQLTKKGISSRARKIRHLWDLRWHEENLAIAQGASDLQQHHCLICRRGLATNHGCPSTSRSAWTQVL